MQQVSGNKLFARLVLIRRNINELLNNCYLNRNQQTEKPGYNNLKPRRQNRIPTPVLNYSCWQIPAYCWLKIIGDGMKEVLI